MKCLKVLINDSPWITCLRCCSFWNLNMFIRVAYGMKWNGHHDVLQRNWTFHSWVGFDLGDCRCIWVSYTYGYSFRYIILIMTHENLCKCACFSTTRTSRFKILRFLSISTLHPHLPLQPQELRPPDLDFIHGIRQQMFHQSISCKFQPVGTTWDHHLEGFRMNNSPQKKDAKTFTSIDDVQRDSISS